ncbi:hypothetical protein CDEST_02512 [Colletotrichum destructivum]|uniref:Uncharacterized protein n=1 Tax=Colletotrichum destructivum TaxID=34406 RepID=A0AAX4I3C2_9PEZI|nr:hypothetical protein CDEST_02512 [Colletotrichum destructivum]
MDEHWRKKSISRQLSDGKRLVVWTWVALVPSLKKQPRLSILRVVGRCQRKISFSADRTGDQSVPPRTVVPPVQTKLRETLYQMSHNSLQNPIHGRVTRTGIRHKYETNEPITTPGRLYKRIRSPPRLPRSHLLGPFSKVAFPAGLSWIGWADQRF